MGTRNHYICGRHPKLRIELFNTNKQNGEFAGTEPLRFTIVAIFNHSIKLLKTTLKNLITHGTIAAKE